MTHDGSCEALHTILLRYIFRQSVVCRLQHADTCGDSDKERDVRPLATVFIPGYLHGHLLGRNDAHLTIERTYIIATAHCYHRKREGEWRREVVGGR